MKAANIRPPLRDPEKAYTKLESDYKKIIKYAYDQAWRVKQKFLDGEKFVICDEKGETLYEVAPRKYREVYTIIVTFERFGHIQTNLADMLDIEGGDDYPWAVNLDDLEIFLLTLKSEKSPKSSFFDFLQFRENFHDHLVCSDELELCGLFLSDRQEFKALSQREEIFVTEASMTLPIERRYAKGMGFTNESFLEEKKSRDSVFLFSQK